MFFRERERVLYMNKRIITEAEYEPVSLQEMKEWMRVEDSDNDNVIEALISAARQKVELDTGRLACTQVWEATIPYFPFHRTPIILSPVPIQQVTSIKYYDLDGVLQTWDDENYLFIPGEPARIQLFTDSDYPDTDEERINAIAIRYVAGYEEDEYGLSVVPSLYRSAIKLLAAYWYENREAVNIGNITSELPLAYKSIVWNLKWKDLEQE